LFLALSPSPPPGLRPSMAEDNIDSDLPGRIVPDDDAAQRSRYAQPAIDPPPDPMA